MRLLLGLTVHSTVYYTEQRKMTSRHRTFSDWLNFCSPNCDCHEMSDFDIDTLLVHHWDLWGFEDISLKSLCDSTKDTPPSPNPLTDIAFKVVADLILHNIKDDCICEQNAETGQFDRWHYNNWKRLFDLFKQYGIPPVIARGILPPLDFGVCCRCRVNVGANYGWRNYPSENPPDDGPFVPTPVVRRPPEDWEKDLL